MYDVSTNRRPIKHARILVVVPAYDEEACIGDVVRDVLDSGIRDVLVIDDGSSDHTAVVAERAGAHVLSLPYNLGIGGAVQAGLKFATVMGYEYVLRIDGDGQHRMSEARRLLEIVQNKAADVAIGARFFPGHQTYTPPRSRMIGIRWFAAMVSFLTRQSSYDTTSGMQALNRCALVVLAKHYPQDYPEVEARILLHKAQLRVVEVPVTMEARSAGMSSINYVRAIYYAFKVSLATVIAAVRRAPRVYSGEL